MQQHKNVLVSFIQFEYIQAKLKMWVVGGKAWPWFIYMGTREVLQLAIN